MVNPFFKNTGPHKLDYLLKAIDLKNGFIIKGYLSKFWIFYVSIIITNYFLSTIVADHCASAIFFPSTNASPLYFQTLP